MYDSEPISWQPDEATWEWLQRIAAERYSGDLGRCLAAVLREARIADETMHRGALADNELPADPWQPLAETLGRRSQGPLRPC